MNPIRAVKLLEMYGTCPQCGNETIRPNKDKLIITENEFGRKCACGFEVELKEKPNCKKGE